MKRDCVCPRFRHKHGTLAAYRYDACRCLICRAAKGRAMTSYRHGGTWREADFVPSAGTHRRLQALAVIGYTAKELAAHLGVTPQMASKMRNDHQNPTIRKETAEKVAAIYNRLWDKPVRTSNGLKCSSMAKRHGYAPPMAWDDDTIDDPAAKPNFGRKHTGQPADELIVDLFIDGHHVTLNAAEQREVIRRLATVAQLDDAAIALRLGMTSNSVCRTRLRHRIPAATRRAGWTPRTEVEQWAS